MSRERKVRGVTITSYKPAHCIVSRKEEELEAFTSVAEEGGLARRGRLASERLSERRVRRLPRVCPGYQIRHWPI